jgi:hypothetical protein
MLQHVFASYLGSETQRLHIFNHLWRQIQKINAHKIKHAHIHMYIENVCNCRAILWNSGEEGKEK